MVVLCGRNALPCLTVFRDVSAMRRSSSTMALAFEEMEKCGKVEVAPFRFRMEQAETFAQGLKVAYTMQTLFPGAGPLLAPLKLLLKLWRGEEVPWWEVKAVRAVWLPVWLLHSLTRFRCLHPRASPKQTAPDQQPRSLAYALWTNTAALPGFAWSPLDRLSMSFEPDSLEDLELFNVARHTKGDVTALPFTRNPLTLPSRLNALAREHPDLATVSPASSLGEGSGKVEALHVMDAQGTEIAVSEAKACQLEADSLDTRMAVYPLLMPFYLVEYEEPTKERHTLVLTGGRDHSRDNIFSTLVRAITSIVLKDYRDRPFWSFWDTDPDTGKRLWWPVLFPSQNDASVSRAKGNADFMKVVLDKEADKAGVLRKPNQGQPAPQEFQKRVKMELEGFSKFLAEATDSVVQDAQIENALSCLLAAPRNVLEAGSVSSWSSSPAVMQYSSAGRSIHDLVELGDVFDESEMNPLPKEMNLDAAERDIAERRSRGKSSNETASPGVQLPPQKNTH